MYPVLFKFGPLTIYTYGFFVAMGVLSSILFARREGKRLGMDPDRITDLCFYIVIAAIVGSRLFYVAVNFGFFLSRPLDIFKIWNGGLVFYGGFIGAVVTALVFLHKTGMPLGKTADIAAMTIPLGHTFGRIGCFFAGCCYGRACSLPWAVTFYDPHSLAPLNIPIHPTELYEAAGNLFIFLFLLLLHRRKKLDGRLFWLYMMSYGILRSIIEQFRGDDRGAFLFGQVSISQTIGLSAAAVSFAMLVLLSRRARKPA